MRDQQTSELQTEAPTRIGSSVWLGPGSILPTSPAYREMVFQVQTTEPMSECINLLAQVMRSYPELKPKGQQAVAAWFAKAYGDDEPNAGTQP